MTDVEQVYTHHKNYASAGVGNAGLATGIIGTSLGVLNSGLLGGNGLFGGMMNNGARYCGADGSPVVSRYELGLEQKIADLTADKKMLEADRYTDSKTLELYTYVDGRLRNIEGQICNQAVINANTAASLNCLQNSVMVLNGMTKTIIPADNVCPPPMPLYNSWTAPTATT